MLMKKDQLSQLLEAARQTALHSYSPYSHFRVGAALLTEDGRTITGTNVENRSYGLGICAERSAVVRAVSEGFRSFVAVAIYAADAEEPVSPCGACRQVLSEFMTPDAPVVFASPSGIEHHTLGELLPFDAMHDFKNTR